VYNRQPIWCLLEAGSCFI